MLSLKKSDCQEYNVPHCSIHKHTWTSDEKTRSQIDHDLMDKRKHSNIIDIQSFRGIDCNTGHYLVGDSIREKLS
jgi:hypothetical protein